MKRNLLSLSKLLTVAAVAMLLFAGTANAQEPKLPANPTDLLQKAGKLPTSPKDVLQTERKLPSTMTESAIAVGTVTKKSAAVNPKDIGKEVAPGVLEVDPDSVRGKRIMMTGGDQTARAVCIGKWKNGECKGVYIEW
jgi:hypothetical protein